MNKKKEILLPETNETLQKMLDEKSVALEHMKRELEIQAALERVRAVAMSMNVPGDMLEICRIIAQQLESLKVKEIRNVQTAIFYESKGIYLNYEFFQRTDKTTITEVEYNLQPDVKQFVHQMLTDAEAFFTTGFKGTKLKEWIEYQEKANQFVDPYLLNAESLHYYFYSIGPGALGISTYAPLNDSDLAVLKRFRNVFELAYRRFMDIEQALAQAREAQIEAALERARAQSMRMQHSNELNDTLQVFHQQLQLLGVSSEFSYLWLPDEENDKHVFWATWEEEKNNSAILKSKALAYPLDRNEPYTAECLDAWKSGVVVHTYKVPPAEVENYFAAWQELLSGPVKLKSEFFPDGLDYVEAYMKYGCFGIVIRRLLTEDEKQILRRFTIEFERAYTRFLDLQKAEAQAREAQIELALERVRARAMAMHNSEDLALTVNLFFVELNALNVTPHRCGVSLVDKESRIGDLTVTVATEEGQTKEMTGKLKLTGHPVLDAAYDNWINQREYHPVLHGDEIKKYYQVMNPHVAFPGFSKDTVQFGHYFSFKEGFVFAWTEKELKEEELQIFRKFTSVLSLTYRRYIDLKDAEAQAREAKIEAGLERVRSRAMAMHKTDELLDAAELVHKELSALGITSMNISYAFVDEDEKYASYYSLNPVDGKIPPFPFVFPHTETEVMRSILTSWKKQEPFNVIELDVEATLKHQTYIGEHIQKLITKNKIDIPFSVEAFLAISPKKAVIYTFNFSKGYLFNIGGVRLTTMQEEMVLRFTRVFEMTYRRFLDLKQAEAQAREAEIELALERVRARTMAMQRSNELADAARLLFQQVKELGVHPWTSGFQLWDEDWKAVTVWTSTEGVLLPPFKMSTTEDPLMIHIAEAAQRGEMLYVEELGGEILADHYKYMYSLPSLQEVFTKLASEGHAPPTSQINHAAYFSNGYLLFITHESCPEAHDIFKRFAKVFEQTYTRFLDLQKAEVQAKEAQIEGALERVRSRTMAMYRSEEIADILGKIFSELKLLDVVLNRILIWIFNHEERYISWWSANSEVESNAESYRVDYNEHPVFQAYLEAWQNRIPLLLYSISGAAKVSWEDHLFNNTGLSKLPTIVQNGMRAEGTIFTTSAISDYGLLMSGSLEPLSDENTDIIQRFGRVFQQSYTRYLDVQKAEILAREAKIEAALERVRARTMAMHSSEDLSSAIATMFTELEKLGIENVRCGIANIRSNQTMEVWSATNAVDGKIVKGVGIFDMNAQPFWRAMYKAWANKDEFLYYYMGGKEKDDYIEVLNKYPNYLSQPIQQFPDMSIQSYYFGEGVVWTFSLQPHSEEDKLVMKRFSSVFSLTFRRYQDLKKAEAQARESQIQLAMERVRARTMAMQHSEELAEAASLLFKQISDLGTKSWSSGFNIWQADEVSATAWMPNPDGSMGISFTVPYTEDPFFRKIYAAMRRGEDFFVMESGGKELEETYKYMFNLPDAKKHFDVIESLGFQIPIFQITHCVFFSQGYLMFITYEPCPEMWDIFKRFGKVFEQTYTRFLDLQKAEAQAREAQIELSLERVRAKTMAMHNSQDVAETVATMFDEFVKLGIETIRVGIGIMHEDRMEAWTARQGTDGKVELIIGHLNMTLHPLLQGAYDGWKNKKETFEYELGGDDLINYYTILNNYPAYPIKYDIASLPPRIFHHDFYFAEGTLYVFSENDLSTEASKIIRRFAAVFGQTYRRYLDLKKAEANAREAQIEAGLERVRSRTMAMHKSEELLEVITVVSDQLQLLKLKFNTVSFAINNQDHDYKFWFAVIGNPTPIFIEVPYLDNPMFNRVKEVLEQRISFYADTLTPEESRQWHEHVFANTDMSHLSEETKAYVLRSGYARSVAIMPSIMLIISNYAAQPYADEENDIIRRFAAVFEQAYTRFLDLQRAEAQARESQIQLALERVRARTMAMQSQNELIDLITLLSEQMQSLGCRIDNATFSNGLCEKDWDIWVANPSLKMPAHRLYIPWFNHPYFLKTAEGLENHKQTGQDLNVALFTKDEKDSFLDHLFSNTTYKDSPSETRQFLYDQPAFTFSAIFLKETWVSIGKYVLEPYAEEENAMLRRFALAFGQAYTRFLDLRKAETQAREATIEAALERVRGKAMAMHNSDDLPSTASTVFSELKKLGLNSIRNGVGLLSKQNRKVILYSTTSSDEGEHLSMVGSIMLQDHPVLTEIYDSWLNRNDYFPVLQGEELKSYHEKVLSAFALSGSSYAKNVLPNEQISKNAGYNQYGHFMPFSEGYLFDWSEQPRTEAEIFILKRFVSVIDLTFRRFIELQKSEANAREAVRQAALDRIRADIASMRAVSDLDRITPLIWKELTVLGVTFMRCGVFIMDETQELIHTFLSTPDGKAIAAFHLPYSTPGKMKVVLTHWQNNSIYADHWEEADFKEMANILVQQNAITTPDEYLRSLPKEGFYLHFIPFLQGMLYVGCLVPLVEDQISLVQSVADAFSTAYARYEDFNKLEGAKQQVDKALVDLKQAQQQLVQSEKMASLGELTAGIAHEIQNPLNFVNNFSEVNSELIQELNQEIEKGNLDEVRSIATSLKENEEKIAHHGKRADSIVKGMLQHSRTSTGQKEPTDINALADEYLRLSYHGFRAKDKSFNAAIKTDFDKTIQTINIIPQEIGRLLLNLYNNAFYAVMEKKKLAVNNYEPTISVSTKTANGKVIISVRDNGTGIPQKAIDKIFQPFFTTKPAGKGTGLGLSLAYDIVSKGHGGEIKVESKENEGAEFIIQLPVV